jgi:hypothetical protein
MHATFAPGFPGLLEAFYVQEKVMQRMLPGVYAVFVSAGFLLFAGETDASTEAEHDLDDRICRQVVHYIICQYRVVSNATATMGCILSGGGRYNGPHVCCHSLGL